MVKRGYNFLFLFLLLSAIGGAVFLYFQHRASSPQNFSRDIPTHGHSKHRLEIGGFQFQGLYKGKTILSIKADKFTIEKKKLGFLSLGPVNVAKFRNAVVDVYGRSKGPDRAGRSKSTGRNFYRSHNSSKLYQDVTFKDMFRKEALPSVPMRGISLIKIGPICLNLHTERSLITQINASSASIRLKQRNITFTGNVRVVSGSNSLTTERLIFFPEQAIIRMDGSYVLKTSKNEVVGVDLSTDILLSSANIDLKNDKTSY